MKFRSATVAAACMIALSACSAGDPAPSESDDINTTAPSSSPADPSETQSPDPDASESPEGMDSPLDGFAMPPLSANGFPGLLTSRAIVDVSATERDGYDRIVVEFSEERSGSDEGGEVPPGYSVEYVDAAQSDGSGEEVKVPGNAIMDIHISGVAYPAKGVDPENFGSVDGAGTLLGIEVSAPFEGMAQLVVGLDEERPVRVNHLTKPMRLVIDIQDPL